MSEAVHTVQFLVAELPTVFNCKVLPILGYSVPAVKKNPLCTFFNVIRNVAPEKNEEVSVYSLLLLEERKDAATLPAKKSPPYTHSPSRNGFMWFLNPRRGKWLIFFFVLTKKDLFPV